MSDPTEAKVTDEKDPFPPRTVALLGALLFLAGAMLPLFATGHPWMIALRWAGLFAFLLIGIRKRSLTYWIFVALLAGAEVGHDWPSAAVDLQLLGTIFLRLIKVIIAPLLFS